MIRKESEKVFTSIYYNHHRLYYYYYYYYYYYLDFGNRKSTSYELCIC